MAHVLSQNAKLYRNTGTYSVPVWDLIGNVKDLTLSLEKDETDVTTRASGGWKEFVDGMKDATVEFGMLWDTGDADFDAFQGAFINNTSVEILVLDGLVATTGSEGLRATMMVKSFTRNENLGEALMVDVSLRPVKNSNSAPVWYTAT
jgi:predicted secreted protein